MNGWIIYLFPPLPAGGEASVPPSQTSQPSRPKPKGKAKAKANAKQPLESRTRAEIISDASTSDSLRDCFLIPKLLTLTPKWFGPFCAIHTETKVPIWRKSTTNAEHVQWTCRKAHISTGFFVFPTNLYIPVVCAGFFKCSSKKMDIAYIPDASFQQKGVLCSI